MAVCKFFLQGHCRYGDNCWNDHPRSQGSYDLRQKLSYTPAGNQGNQGNSYQKGGYGNYRGNQEYAGSRGGYGNNQKFSKNQNFQQNRFQPLADQGNSSSQISQGAQNSDQTDYTPQQILQSMSQDMDEWTKSNMWPFSCFTFLKDMPSFPGFDDFAPEEVRLKAYEAEASGTGQSYRDWYTQLLNEYATKKAQILKPSISMKMKLVEAVQSIQKAAKAGESTTSSSATSQGLFGNSGSSSSGFGSSAHSAPKGFFGGATSAQQTSGSVFGGGANQPIDLSKGLFGNTFSTNQNAGGSLFGGGGSGISQTADQSKGLFSNVTTNQSSGSSVFGGAANQTVVDQSKGLFGNSSATLQCETTKLFGANTQTQNQSTGLFGNQATAGGIFGGGTSQTGNQSSGPFGGSGSTGSVFGGSAQTGAQSSMATGGFSNTATTGAATGLFGKTAPTAQTGNTAFGQAPVVNTSQPPAFTNQPLNPTTSTPSQPDSGGGAQSGGLQKSGMYTQLADLTTEEKTAFEAPKFVLGRIPTRPPPRELV